jgi:ectoine hydroxylase-related dioxygenase (phytanoyl-CoA dioxygenase family)
MTSAAMPSYGVLEQSRADGTIESVAEEVTSLGYSAIDAGYSPQEIVELKRIFDDTHQKYVDAYGEGLLKEIDEHNGIRLPLALHPRFLDVAANDRVLRLVEMLIRNKFVLNQQNGVINPANGAKYNQGAWHRDLPYQHFVSSRPLAINALYCVDDFTAQNGATFVLPASHLHEACPSVDFIEKHAVQISAPAGSFIVLDCMLYHRGGENRTSSARRGVNHVYTSAFIRQQIDIPAVLGSDLRRPELSDLLGYRYRLPRSVPEFLTTRRR